MKKFRYIPLALLLLTACAKNDNTPDLTTAPASETTSLTLTEALTEERVPEPGPVKIEFAVFDPFSDNVRSDGRVYDEMSEAAEKISDGYGFWLGGMSGFCGYSKYSMIGSYSDEENPLEVNEEDEYSYAPLTAGIADNEQELFEYLRGCFTENYISDDKLRDDIFSPRTNPNGYVVRPLYKTIDEVLCIKHQYMGVYSSIAFKEMTVISYDGDSAEIMTGVHSASDDGYVFFLKLKKSEEYGWRLDGLDRPFFDKNAVSSVYNLSRQVDTLNGIFDGAPDESRPTEIDGETYYPADTGMDIRQMKEYFGLIFTDDILNGDGSHTKIPLKDAYIEKYIDSVYTERGGTLYRKADEPRRYIPEMTVDLHTSASENWSDQWGRHAVETPYSPADGNIVVEYSWVPDEYDDPRAVFTRFASELPVKTKE